MAMMKETKTLAVITARGGSKGIPQKNVKVLLGKPLIAYSIQAALQSRTLTKIIVSTDDETIAHVSEQYGAEVPFLRPKHLASDNATSLSVLQHAVRQPVLFVQLKTLIKQLPYVQARVQTLLFHYARSNTIHTG